MKGEAKMITGEKLNEAVHAIEIRSNDNIGRRVSPGRKQVKKLEFVEWRNVAREKIRVTFPNADKVFDDFPSIGYADIDFTDVDRYHVKENPIHGEYPYHVYGLQSHEYYIGDSDPRIDVL
jgi:hypothetical protein